MHLVGCGGVGMTGLTELLLHMGIPVSGSELRADPTLDRLRRLGGTVHTGHDASNVHGADTVVYSTSIPDDHAELVEARRLGLQVLHRAEALAIAMRGHEVLAVAGTHGKTSTTAMAVAALGFDVPFVVGGEITGIGNAGYGDGTFVVEADESDRSFLNFSPHAAIVTNIDSDHLDTYGDMAELRDTFLEFCRRVSGFLVTCADDPRCRDLAARVDVPVHTYGLDPDADLRVTGLSSGVNGVRYRALLGGNHHEVELPVPGNHLGLNSAAALLAAVRLGRPVDTVVAGLAEYPGVGRRFELKGIGGGVRVYDDYACHHTSMEASLRTMRDLAGDGRLLAVCQPCRTYRLRDFQDEMAAALALADQVVVTSVFAPAGPGPDGASLTRAVPLPSAAKSYVDDWSAVSDEVARRARPGDLVVTLGAPAVSAIADQILDALRRSG
ncbi:UDP-N-acetylmuramate--alanine ligase [Kutzneria buriramensis]|uniref:UDP-N-acetylmuramate--L-alanine ligase n=1 Tax=Kutzneria buriramensis TaxID=1045776 RepID=A0A3E0GXV4_9PSEU|nr:UDP-N-acetylmuramate--alanine ligase [Kutzneria buriramensis]